MEDRTGRIKMRSVIQNTAVNRHWKIRGVTVKKNPDLLRALKYLKEHDGYEEFEDDESRPTPSPGPQSRPEN